MNLKLTPKLSANVSKISWVWVGDLYKQRKLHTFLPILISRFTYSFKSGSQSLSRIKIYDNQIPPLLVLVGLSWHTKLYPGSYILRKFVYKSILNSTLLWSRVWPVINKEQKYLLLPDHQFAKNLILVFGFLERKKRDKSKFVTKSVRIIFM